MKVSRNGKMVFKVLWIIFLGAFLICAAVFGIIGCLKRQDQTTETWHPNSYSSGFLDATRNSKVYLKDDDTGNCFITGWLTGNGSVMTAIPCESIPPKYQPYVQHF